MIKPKDYYGELRWQVPEGYIDITLAGERRRHGVPGPDHPYYTLRDKITSAILGREVQQNPLVVVTRECAVRLADHIMEVL